MSLPPFRKVNFVETRVDVERRDDGSVVLENPHPMGDAAANVIEPLKKWAAEKPDQVWLAKRRPPKAGETFGEWETVTFAEAYDRVRRIAQALIDRGVGPGKPLMILSGNSIEHALMTYGAILTGAPAVPVSPSYSLISSDYAKLRYVFELIEPQAIFVQDGLMFEDAMGALDVEKLALIHVEKPAPAFHGSTSYEDLLATEPTDAVDAAYDALTYDTVAKYLFTSGSTGMPKAVITTHRMMCVNSVMASKLIEEDEDEPAPTLVNWLPWNHVFGGNAVLNNLLTAGGTLYIDGGRPVPGQFAETVQNLREVAPTTYTNVPAAYTMLIEELEKDDALAKNFFSQLRSMGYGGAALNQDLAERMQAVAIRVTGERILFTSGYGATETAPTIMNTHWETERMGLLGLPLPGVKIKLVPAGLKMEVRVKGDCITPGYYKNPEKTAEAFDEEGYYRLGDAAKFVDDNDPKQGLVFNGRVVEDFKLSSGTWVNAGRMRVQAVEAGNGLINDCLVAGLDEPYVGILGFPNLPACRKAAGLADDTPAEDVVRAQGVLERIAEGLKAHNAKNPGSSTQIHRAILLAEPPSLDAGELTDKGYINQSVSLSRRADKVAKLFADPPGNDVVVV
ncbi:AMP-binding protein [Pyruvatibacter mobilis]|uniref:AMP-binding protein n=1 Tax=Pyruvatibacter mobilis TaxID=1712261 RepID=UPI003BAC044E